jgi:hypothetical protein
MIIENKMELAPSWDAEIVAQFQNHINTTKTIIDKFFFEQVKKAAYLVQLSAYYLKFSTSQWKMLCPMSVNFGCFGLHFKLMVHSFPDYHACKEVPQLHVD